MIEVEMDGAEYTLSPSKIVCLLRTYAAHARELDNPVPERPLFFLKPPSALLQNGGTVIIPEGVKELHHEVELAVLIGKRGHFIPVDRASGYVMGYTVMLDITVRDLQNTAKEMGLPWTEAKGYDTFAPIGPEIVPADAYDWHDRRIWLEVNGEMRQDSSTGMMLYSVERIISDISRVMTLEVGDLVLTGTPAGVGPLRAGDDVKAGIDGIRDIEVSIGRA